jgi:hypothetical protein
MPEPDKSQRDEPGNWCCSWCAGPVGDPRLSREAGADIRDDGRPRWISRRGEVFCCRAHRDASSKALRALIT